jgi:hypothetical protein
MHTDNDPEEALAAIRQRTSDPIARFLDAAIASRMREPADASSRDPATRCAISPARVLRPVRQAVAWGLARLSRKIGRRPRRFDTRSRGE